ncbi:MAG: biopolymer transporter ExbD [bacterium]
MQKKIKITQYQISSNIIPMINVAFCIMLILMVISPFLNESKIKVDVPEAASSEVKEENKITLTISSTGKWALEDREIKRSQLADHLRKRIALDISRILVIKADKSVPYHWVREALETAKANGVVRIAIATQSKKDAEQKPKSINIKE